MPSLVPGYEYDIFISYRQKDNKHLSAGQSGDGWVTQFVSHLKEELDATFKQDISIYFDENPHDGLGATHHVDKSLEGKLRCLLLIPIISRTYCDPGCFAWQQEFLAFRDLALVDSFGLEIKIANRNVASRVLPVQIHDLNPEDQNLFEKENGGPLRSIPFIFKSQGVNRPLTPSDSRGENTNKTLYRDQINKTANAVEEIIGALKAIHQPSDRKEQKPVFTKVGNAEVRGAKWFWSELLRRNVFRAGFAYLIVSLAIQQVVMLATPFFEIQEQTSNLLPWMLIGFFPVAMILAWLYEVSPEGWIRTTSPKSTENPYRPSRKKPFTSQGVMLTLVMLLVVQYLFFKYFNIDSDSRKSIAVLNFVDQSDEKKDAYFAEALTNDIIDRLCLIRELRVISPLSSSTYKNSNASIMTIATELNVASILSGTVRRSSEITSISVRLTDGVGTILWSHSYEVKSTGLLDIHSDIAIQIAGVMDIDLDDSEISRLHRNPTVNMTAWDYYQKGRRLYSYYTTDSNDLAIEQFKKAVSLDSNYSLAWSGLGDAYSQLHFRSARGVQWLDSSIASGRRALSLDTNSAEAYKALSNAYFYLKQYDSSFRLLKKAVDKNPKNVQSVYNLGSNYFIQSNLVEALRLMKRAASLNPRSAVPFQLTGWTYRLLGNLPEAESWLKSSLDRNPKLWETYRELAFTYCYEGKRQEALDLVPKMLELGKRDARTLEIAGRIAHLARDKSSAKQYFMESIEKNPNHNSDPNSVSSIGLGSIFLDEGDKIQAEVYLTQALSLNLEQIEKGLKDDDPPYNIAVIYAIQGKKEQSLQWLRKAIEYKWLDYNNVEKGPYFVKFTGDPDLARMLKGVHSRIDSMRNSLPRD